MSLLKTVSSIFYFRYTSNNLLDQYGFERRTYAHDLIAFDKQYGHLFSEKPQSEDNPNGIPHEVFVQQASSRHWRLSSSLALVRRALKTAGGFISGIGVRYAHSAIVNSKHQSHGKHLVIGERVPPQMVVCAADGGPYELQDQIHDSKYSYLQETPCVRSN